MEPTRSDRCTTSGQSHLQLLQINPTWTVCPWCRKSFSDTLPIIDLTSSPDTSHAELIRQTSLPSRPISASPTRQNKVSISSGSGSTKFRPDQVQTFLDVAQIASNERQRSIQATSKPKVPLTASFQVSLWAGEFLITEIAGLPVKKWLNLHQYKKFNASIWPLDLDHDSHTHLIVDILKRCGVQATFLEKEWAFVQNITAGHGGVVTEFGLNIDQVTSLRNLVTEFFNDDARPPYNLILLTGAEDKVGTKQNKGKGKRVVKKDVTSSDDDNGL